MQCMMVIMTPGHDILTPCTLNIHGDHGGQRLGYVDFDLLVVPLSG